MEKTIKPWEVGKKAPDFSLMDSDGNKVKLSELRGQPVVLIFYPGDNTPGCTAQLCAIRDDYSKFKKFKAQVYGVNHAGAESHNKFIDKFGFKFPILIDTDRKVSEKYGAIKFMFGHKSIKRSVIIIDKDGKITWVKRGMPSNAEILDIISGL